MHTRILIVLFGLVIFLSGAQSALASTIFSQTPSNEDLNGPILSSPYLVMFECPSGSDKCGAYGKTVYNVGVWLKKIGNPADIRLQVVNSIFGYPTSDNSNFSNSISAGSASSTAYTLKWFYFPDGVVIGNNQFFLFQFTGANNTSNTTDYYRALYDPNNSYNAPQQWCKIYKGCWSSIFYWMMDDGKTDLSLPPPPPDPCATPGVCASNVLFLPGIEASRLYEDIPCSSGMCETKLWEPNGDATASRLAHDASGVSIDAGVYVKKNGVIDNAYVPIKGNIYKSFIEQMNGLVTAGTVKEWEAIPYDWRLTPDQILGNGAEIAPGKISYLVATSSPYIIQELKRLAATSKTHKVTIIAHSNGGLVTKALTKKLGSNAAKYIDKIVFVAVPQAGAPQAIGALLHGYDQGLPSSFISFGLSDGAARTLATNMPMTYNLLPSKTYFTQVDTPVVTFADQPILADFRARYGDLIHSSEQLHTFITDSWRTASSTTEGLNYPSVGNASLLTQAEILHTTNLDIWTPPTGITLYEVAGWGEKTLAGIDYYQGIAMHCDQFSGTLSRCTKTPKIDYKPRIVLDGDGTVPTPSALWTPGAKRYWVDLNTYAKDNRFTAPLGRQHADILEVGELRAFLKNIITNKDSAGLPQYISTSTPVNQNSDTQLHFTLHSPLALNLYDDQGRHTGVSTTTGELEENIPESSYMKFGEVQFISAPTSLNTHLVMNGYEAGSFTLDAEEVSGETVVASTTFAGIPSDTGTIAVIDAPSGGLMNIGALMVDENGDGHTDITLQAKEGSVVTLDTTPPETTLSATGTVGLHDWYTSDVSITLTATDTESGVASTTYSFDNGTTWQTYTQPFLLTQEGSTTILYYSIDNQGNREATKTLLLQIDKTSPEAQLVFNPTTQKFTILGIDNLSTTTVVSEPLSTALTDQAGHTTILHFASFTQTTQRIALNLESITYDGAVTTLATTTLSYKWGMKKDSYRLFVAYALANTTQLEAHYRPKNTTTIIMTKPVEIDDRDEDNDVDTRPIKNKLPGLVIPGLQTEKGSVKIIY